MDKLDKEEEKQEVAKLKTYAVPFPLEENQGNIQFERSDGAEYHMPDEPQQVTYYTSTRATYKAKTGALYIFPGWLKHSVQGNLSNTDRISVSFNYGPSVRNWIQVNKDDGNTVSK